MSIKTWNAETQTAEPLVPGTVEVEHYSTEEVKTNNVWIDGKPIYRKVIKTSQSLTNGITIDTIQDFSEVVRFDAFILLPNKITYNIPYATGKYTNMQFQSNVVKFFTSDTWDGGILTVILEYTKTTD